jgi:hypothetical protein
MVAETDGKLGYLTRRYPGWRIWRGRVTGDVWALPPPGSRLRRSGLVGAADADALEAKIAEIVSWESNQPWSPAGPAAT